MLAHSDESEFYAEHSLIPEAKKQDCMICTSWKCILGGNVPWMMVPPMCEKSAVVILSRVYMKSLVSTSNFPKPHGPSPRPGAGRGRFGCGRWPVARPSPHSQFPTTHDHPPPKVERDLPSSEKKWNMADDEEFRSCRLISMIDFDCFYAQVHVKLRPDLKGKPVGVQQKYLMVTCNYEARKQGVKKMQVFVCVRLLFVICRICGFNVIYVLNNFVKRVQKRLSKFVPGWYWWMGRICFHFEMQMLISSKLSEASSW